MLLFIDSFIETAEDDDVDDKSDVALKGVVDVLLIVGKPRGTKGLRMGFPKPKNLVSTFDGSSRAVVVVVVNSRLSISATCDGQD